MTTKNITICDGCGEELKKDKDKYYICLNSGGFLSGAGDRTCNTINLDFCENCAKHIKCTLDNILAKYEHVN